MMKQEDVDFALALSLQDQFDQEAKTLSNSQDLTTDTYERRYDPRCIVDKDWELIDPTPNIHDLFVDFDGMFFKARLVTSGVEVRWSNRMTLCAGVCSYEGRGGLCSIGLSKPLLKLRPRRDLVETLLHEMIHAYLFVTANYKDHDAHGPNFLEHMHRINKLSGANITVFHTFHDEVSEYRQHWWKCTGPCQDRPPYYGTVKRAMNRAPSPKDPWWSEHARTCGGTYVKIKEPEGYGNKKSSGLQGSSDKGKDGGNKGKGKRGSAGSQNIKDLLSKDGRGKDVAGPSTPVSQVRLFQGKGHRMSSDSSSARGGNTLQGSSSLREKLAAAAEKRIRESKERRRKGTTLRSKKRTSAGSYDIRNFQTSQSGHPAEGKEPKRTRFSTDSDCVVVDMPVVAKNVDTVAVDSIDIEPPSITKGQQSSGKDPSVQVHVIDLEDFEELHTTCGRKTNPANESGVVSLDEESGDGANPTGMRTCPVCGLSDIPASIINVHVTLCLDEPDLL